MAGCSIVMLLLILLGIGLIILVAMFGVFAFCFVLGAGLLVLSFTALKKKDDPQKYQGFRITFIVIGILLLLMAVVGSCLLAAGLFISMNGY